MPKVGRNDPCPCGSGKKYKQCHLPIEEAQRTRQRQLVQAQETLMPRLITAAQALPEIIPVALERFWNGKYGIEQLSELDELEQRGADRFLSWLVFDYVLDDGRTLTERLAAGDHELELTEDEATLLSSWENVHLRPYVVEQIRKGQGLDVRDMLNDQLLAVADHAASQRVALGEVLIAHLLPVGEIRLIGSAVAHLTADVQERLREFLDLHRAAFAREHPDASWDDMLRQRSELLNHFIMALPVESPDPTFLESFIAQTRASLTMAGESIGLIRPTSIAEADGDSDGAEDDPISPPPSS